MEMKSGGSHQSSRTRPGHVSWPPVPLPTSSSEGARSVGLIQGTSRAVPLVRPTFLDTSW